MTDDEKRIITEFVQRVVRGDAPPAAPSPWGRPAAQPAAPPREPIDAEADALLKQLHDAHPEARYRLAQLAFVQEHAMAEAQNRINQLEWELENKGKQGGMLGGLFGGGRPATPPPAPVHAPGFQPGMFQNRPGFLGTAASMAMGVAGGMLLGSVIGSMLGGGAAQAATPPAPDAMATPTSSAYEDTGIDSAVFDDEEL